MWFFFEKRKKNFQKKKERHFVAAEEFSRVACSESELHMSE